MQDIHSRVGKTPNQKHSRPALRSGWRASLRREGLSLRWAPFAKARARHT